MTHPYTPPPHDAPFVPVYEDEDIFILEKPSGLLSVPGRGDDKQDCLSERAKAQFGRVFIIHRLDMETSGLMVFAKHGDAQKNHSAIFEARMIDKTYHALVAGHPEPERGRIELPLIRDWPNRPRQMVDHEKGKPARTDWEVRERLEGMSRVQLLPRTGRTHQLRVHMAAIGHPILGDPLYGVDTPPSPIDRLCLHASRLVFRHPLNQRLIDVSSRPPF